MKAILSLRVFFYIAGRKNWGSTASPICSALGLGQKTWLSYLPNECEAGIMPSTRRGDPELKQINGLRGNDFRVGMGRWAIRAYAGAVDAGHLPRSPWAWAWLCLTSSKPEGLPAANDCRSLAMSLETRTVLSTRAGGRSLPMHVHVVFEYACEDTAPSGPSSWG